MGPLSAVLAPIVNLLRVSGRIVHATDLVDYGLEDSTSRIDFLMERRAPPGTQAIVTNPPNKLATEFAEHALLLCPRVMLLQPIQFLGSAKRTPILRWRRASAGARDQASLADDAQARLDRPHELKPNLLRVVCLGIASIAARRFLIASTMRMRHDAGRTNA